MNSLTDLEYRILDELYFLSSFQTLSDNLNEDDAALKEKLKTLLERNLVAQMLYEESLKDYRRLDVPDLAVLEESYFVATKDGLLVHNSRN